MSVIHCYERVYVQGNQGRQVVKFIFYDSDRLNKNNSSNSLRH